MIQRRDPDDIRSTEEYSKQYGWQSYGSGKITILETKEEVYSVIATSKQAEKVELKKTSTRMIASLQKDITAFEERFDAQETLVRTEESFAKLRISDILYSPYVYYIVETVL